MTDPFVVYLDGETEISVTEEVTEVVTEVDDLSVLVEEVSTSSVVVEESETTVLVEEDVFVLEETVDEVHVIEVVEQGPAGPPGPQGDPGPQGPPGAGQESVAFAKLAAEPLSAHRAVSPVDESLVEYASSDSIQPHRPIWLTKTAALTGNVVSVHAFGSISEGSWNWTPGEPIWLGLNGVLTQTPPSSPSFQYELAVAESPTTIFFDPKFPLLLA